MSAIALPRRAPGRKSAAREAAEHAIDIAFCEWMESRYEETGFAFGTRGWAYIAEGEGIITKGEFDSFEMQIGRLRKEGLLNPDCVADDDSRAASHVEYIDDEGEDAVVDHARLYVRALLNAYTPISQWEGLSTYCEVMVEKVDLKVLFDPVCSRYGVPLTNGKGSTDINSRRRMLQRFREHFEQGRHLVLLYCGDHDPAGLRISDVIASNLAECANVQDVRFDPAPIRVIRFGLNADQIDALRLPWIDNLGTGSGKDLSDPRHPDFHRDYVQTYLRNHGPRKVEANALARTPAAAQAMVEAAINAFVPPDWPRHHAERLLPYREQARAAFESLIGEEGL